MDAVSQNAKGHHSDGPTTGKGFAVRARLTEIAKWGLLLAVGGGLFAYMTVGSPDDETDVAESNREVLVSKVKDQQQLVPIGLDLSMIPVDWDGTNVPADVAGISRDLNEEFRQLWKARGLKSTSDADWRTLCRRLSLALVGTGMSVKEYRNLQRLPEKERFTAHLENLLSSQRFSDYWAERLTRVYAGHENGPFIVYRRRKFRLWLSQQISNGVPYDQLVRSLVSADGLWTEDPAVNFLTRTNQDGEEDNQPDPITLAARTTRAFLGLRIDCLQCHDDFLGTMELGSLSEPREGTQQDFHQLAAFYAPARMFISGVKDENDRQYEYQYLDADEKEVVPAAVPFGEEYLPREGSQRERLAGWLTDPQNKPAARAAVARFWALMFGRSMTETVDDIPLHGPLPTGMDRLADDFVEHKFDIRRVIRAIAYSSPFQRDSRSFDFDITQAHEDAWAAFPLSRLRPEQVAGCIVQASRLKTIDDQSSILTQLQSFNSINDFITRYGVTV
ncbi:MAG: DUF1549 domain-containing protein, partial [Planctomycetota bacterium]